MVGKFTNGAEIEEGNEGKWEGKNDTKKNEGREETDYRWSGRRRK